MKMSSPYANIYIYYKDIFALHDINIDDELVFNYNENETYTAVVNINNTTQIINGKGNTDIIVKTIGVGTGNITDEVLLIELQ